MASPTVVRSSIQVEHLPNSRRPNSHALLLKLLTHLLASTAEQGGGRDVRVIWLTSQGHAFHPPNGIVFGTLKMPQAGLSPVGRTIGVEEGCWSQVWAGTVGREEVKEGGYYEPVGVLTEPIRKERE